MVGLRDSGRPLSCTVAEKGGKMVQGQLVNAIYGVIGEIPRDSGLELPYFVVNSRFFGDDPRCTR
jgi:hypothetical protein